MDSGDAVVIGGGVRAVPVETGAGAVVAAAGQVDRDSRAETDVDAGSQTAGVDAVVDRCQLCPYGLLPAPVCLRCP